ncbi:metallophosphoesterase [Enterococcus saccharolyticus]|uniref:Phosphoesterase n=1 Tax=Candidatus Enterococcus willemsii TaxID=1857215 RepID=A0ABQ6YYG6_9ENTE|nr:MULTISPECIES: metallophosphoesterase [Enterococcus]KAF1302927.1 YfcE family phosphodiesterase [Enterococcus sp. CU12B]MCD5000922.1 metallophosphoesterase [Enterococcus saccharolyticus]
MKYLVVSDNHGDRKILVDLFQHYQGKVDYMIHCGDSELPSSDELWQSAYVVTGNCDYDAGYKKNQLIDTGQDRIYVTHGHLSNVRMGVTQLGIEAQTNDATIVLFGHTHQIGCEKVGSRLFLNPGSISQPRGPIQIKSYAIIDSTPEAFHVQYYNREFEAIPDLAFTFAK